MDVEARALEETDGIRRMRYRLRMRDGSLIEVSKVEPEGGGPSSGRSGRSRSSRDSVGHFRAVNRRSCPRSSSRSRSCSARARPTTRPSCRPAAPTRRATRTTGATGSTAPTAATGETGRRAELEDGEHFGFVEEVDASGGTLVLDLAYFLTGEAANEAAAERGDESSGPERLLHRERQPEAPDAHAR